MEKARFLMERDNAIKYDVLLEDVESAPHLDEESTDNGNENEGSPGFKGYLTHTIPTTRDSPLYLAIRDRICHVVGVLVEKLRHINCYQHVINTKDSRGNTMSHLANFREQLHTWELLLEDCPSYSSMGEVNGGHTASDIAYFFPEQEEEVHIKMEEILTRAEALRGIVEHKPDNRINQEVYIEVENKRYNNPLPQQTTWSEYPTSWYSGLLIAATLLATITFHAALNLSNDFPIEINHLFILFNSIAFFTSVALITLLTYELPLNPWLLIIVSSAIGAYMCTIMAVSPHEVVNVLFIGSFISLAAFFKCLALDKIAGDYIQWMCARIQLI